MKKIDEVPIKIYKPEILVCPKCGGNLKYKYTISNKVVQFSSGKTFRIKNLGYGCIECNDKNTYFSQTANKLCFKGYTYSSKIVCMIDYYKKRHMGRDTICDVLESKGVEISDRNIDILHKKFKEILNEDYDKTIFSAYENMKKEYNDIRISLDFITVNEIYYVILYDFFTGDKLAIWSVESLNDIDKILSKYINDDLNITHIFTSRCTSKIYPIIKKLVSCKTKIFSFSKF